MKKILIVLLLFSAKVFASECPVIPQPVQSKSLEGSVGISAQTPIRFVQPELERLANFLQLAILKSTKITLPVQQSAAGKGIVLQLTGSSKQLAGAYQLAVKPDGVHITSATQQGLFYGIQSFLQLVKLGELKNNTVSIGCWQINDAPHYEWRGLLLDESRHFFGKEVVKELLDWMAFYKLNKLHWHLTDAPGWRLEIKAYPKLALVGGMGNHTDSAAAPKYYTQDDVREIVRYAAERYIDVIPEIDMPGHASAANRAYPAFSGGGSPKYPEFTFHPAKDSTYQYLTNILHETDALFPSQMIHLGGDEVDFGNAKWKTDARVKQLMADHQFNNLVDVEHYFTRRMADSVFKFNNKVLLWDEAADNDLPVDKTIICWWRHDHPEQLKKALDRGFQTVLCPRLPFYFDFVQDSTQRYGRRWQGAFVPIDKLYQFNPGGIVASKAQQQQILGVEAALWTENILSRFKLEYMLFPRIAALAEVAWNEPGQRNLPQFNDKLKLHLQLYKKGGLYYYDPFNPAHTPEPVTPEEL